MLGGLSNYPVFFSVEMRTVFDQVTASCNAKGVFNRHLHPFIQSISIKVIGAESWRMSTRNAAQSSALRSAECKKNN